MKKLTVLRSAFIVGLLFLFPAISCGDKFEHVKPIEKYKGFTVVSTQKGNYSDTQWLLLKSSDTIFYVEVLSFDLQSLKVGDTLK